VLVVTASAVAFLESPVSKLSHNQGCKEELQLYWYGGQMVRSQGKYFSKGELDRIVMLLRESEMSLPEIADRMRCSRSAVAAINRKFQVRLYGGRRSQWSVNCSAAPAEEKILDVTLLVTTSQFIRSDS
jgi:hypothetical protein